VKPAPKLRRSLGLVLLSLYGLGTIIGAGVYVLVGEVAGLAGYHAPWAFLLSSVMVAFTALSFAELSSRFPRSAGQAVYVHEGLGGRLLPMAVGFMVVSVGLVSSAAITNGFIGYLGELVSVPRGVAIGGVVVAMMALAIWGIAESVTIASIATVIEIGGILIVIGGGSGSLAGLPDRLPDLLPTLDAGALAGIGSAALLAFFAFIGFEDMVNVAEEVRRPQKTLPRAIVLALTVTVFLYVGLSLIAVLTVPIDELSKSQAPLALVFERGTGLSPVFIIFVAMIAVLNGALIQIIMASRVVYGMARQRWLPSLFAQINAKTQTPVVATVAVAVLVLGLSLWLPLVTLAKITSLFTLTIHVLVNLSLVRLKWRDVSPPTNGMRLPIWVPACGFLISLCGSLALAAEFMGLR